MPILGYLEKWQKCWQLQALSLLGLIIRISGNRIAPILGIFSPWEVC